MEASNPVERLRAEAVAAFEPAVDPNAPGLLSVLRRSVEFAHVDAARSQIVVDRRALLLAMVAIGFETSSQYSNMATWFADWLKHRLPGRDFPSNYGAGRTSEEALLAAAGDGFKLVLSESVRGARNRAIGIAENTVGRSKISLRHLFFALLEQPNHKFEIEEFGWSATEADHADLRRLMFERMGSDPESSESMEAWRSLLGQASPEAASPAAPMPNQGPEGLEGLELVEEEDTSPAEPDETGAGAETRPPPSPAYFVSGFSADRTTDHGSDPLETEADVLAMARLICHEDADPPISIGVFGGWGSGKSSFMEALQWEAAQLAAAAAGEEQSGDGPNFVAPIVQVRFNAWQFADANLWASLTAEFFDQLRAGGFEGGGKRAHGRLVEEVNEHVRGLSQEAALRRAALAKAGERLRDAQFAHDEAVTDSSKGVRHAMISGLAEAYEANRADLARFGLLDPRSADQMSEFLALAKDARSLGGRLARIFRILWTRRTLSLALIAAAALAAGAIAWFIAGRDFAPLAAAGAALAGLLPLLGQGLALIRTLVERTSPFADRIEEAEKAGLKSVLEKEVALRAAAEEAEALRAVSERADRALARYVDPSARSNPPRVLRYLLEDDPDTKAFEQEIGLIGRARRLFHALDEIVGENRARKERLRALRALPPAARSHANWMEMETLTGEVDREIPDRIIIYIDDLDRCTHRQVYKVLQAVHLLLAFKLFVVVVAVDMEWVEAAVAKSIEFAGKESEEADVKEDARRQRAIEYLSKIFQLPFWLKPFGGADDDRYANYIRTLTRAAPEAAPSPTAPSDRPPPEQGGSGEKPDEGLPPAEEAPPPSPPPPAAADGDREKVEASGPTIDSPGPDKGEAPDVARALRTLQVALIEEDFLAGPEISALAATDPRGVKRLVNVYKIARARLSETDDTMILGAPGRPAAFPLIALLAAVETGQSLEIADNFYSWLKTRAGTAMLGEWDGTDAIGRAIAAVREARQGIDASVGEALAVARVVRRYSFNKYH